MKRMIGTAAESRCKATMATMKRMSRRAAESRCRAAVDIATSRITTSRTTKSSGSSPVATSPRRIPATHTLTLVLSSPTSPPPTMPNHSEMMATVVATLERITKTIESIESRLGLTDDRQQAVKELQKPPLLVTLTALADEEAEKSNSTLINPMELESVDSALELSSPFEHMRQSSTPLLLTTSTESAEGNSIEWRWKHQSISRLSKVTFGKTHDDTRSEIIFCDLNILEHSGPLPVCEIDSVNFTSVFVTKMAFVGSWCPTQPSKVVPKFVKPPAKPPDVFINLLHTLDSHMSPKLLSISNEYVHGLGGVLVVEKSDFDLLRLVRSEHLHTWISRLQTKIFYVYSGMRGHVMACYNILCPWNDVKIILLRFGKPLWLPTDVTSYIFLWHGLFKFIKVGKFVKSLDVAGFVIVLKNEELILCGFVQKVRGMHNTLNLCASSSFVVLLLIISAAVTRYLSLHLICKHVIDYTMWFNGAYEDKVHVHVVLVLCSGALLDQIISKKMDSERVVVAALCRVIGNVQHYCRYLVMMHIDWILKDYLVSNKHQGMLLVVDDFVISFFIEGGLIVADLVGYFEAGSAKLDQPIIMGWSGEVIVKGFAKFLVCKEQATLKHDIIIIGIATEGISSSKFSFTIGTAWVKKMPCKFSWKVIPWIHTCLTQDSEAVKVYLERSGLKRHYNSVMRCLSDYFSIISSGCYIEYPLMLKAKSTWMVDWYLQINDMIEFMMTLQRVEKDGQIFGTHGVQILFFSAHQKGYDFFPKKISHWVAFFASHWITFPSQIYAPINWKVAKMEGTQIYENNLQQHILFESLGSERQTEYGEDAISLKFISAASYNAMVAAVVVNEGSHDSSTTSQLTQWYVTQIPSCHSSSRLQQDSNALGAYLVTLMYGFHFVVYCARMLENARCISLENHVMQQQFDSNDQQSLLGATGMRILLSIEMRQCSHAPSYVVKIEPLAEACDPVTFTRLEIVAGLKYLKTKKHELVASKILQPGIEWGNTYSELTASQDVAIYGRLCALASFDSTELKNKVINNSNFKSFLEFVTEVRELINDFHSSHYPSSLGNFGDNKSDLFLDINEHPPAEATWNTIARIQHEFPTFDLEDKVPFERGSNVTDCGAKEAEQDGERCIKEGTTAKMKRMIGTAAESRCKATMATMKRMSRRAAESRCRAAVDIATSRITTSRTTKSSGSSPVATTNITV